MNSKEKDGKRFSASAAQGRRQKRNKRQKRIRKGRALPISVQSSAKKKQQPTKMCSTRTWILRWRNKIEVGNW